MIDSFEHGVGRVEGDVYVERERKRTKKGGQLAISARRFRSAAEKEGEG